MTTSTMPMKCLQPRIDCFVSVILPVSNAGKNLTQTIEQTALLLAENYAFYEIVIVDDASTDSSATDALALLSRIEGVRFIQLARSCGLDIAALAGIDSAIGDYVIVLVPGIDEPKYIPQLVALVKSSQSILYGVPQFKRKNSSLLRRGASFFFSTYCQRYLKIDIQRGSSFLRAMNRHCANQFTKNKDFSSSLRLITASMGVAAIPFYYEPLVVEGQKRVRWQDLDKALEVLVSISSQPMRLFSRVCILIAFSNIVYDFYVLLVFFLKENVAPGWTTLSLQTSLMFFLLFCLLALLSESVRKLLQDSRGGSLYQVIHEAESAVLVDASKKLNIYNKSI